MTVHRDPRRQAALMLANKFMGVTLLALVVAFVFAWWMWPDLIAVWMGRRL